MSRKVTAQQNQVIEQLLLGKSQTAAAASVGIARETVSRWLKQPGFRQALVASEMEAAAELRRGLVGLREEAIKTIQQVMNDPKAPPAARLKAVEIIIGGLSRLRLEDIDQRLSTLEGEKQQ